MHKLSNVDETTATADCEVCGPGARVVLLSRGPDRPRGWRCHTGSRRRHRGAPTPASKHRRKLRSRGAVFDREDLDAILAVTACQNPGCRGEVNLVVDHNHETGALRGRLCRDCNLALGLLRDDVARITGLADYLNLV